MRSFGLFLQGLSLSIAELFQMTPQFKWLLFLLLPALLTGCTTLSPKTDRFRAAPLKLEEPRTHPNCLGKCPIGKDKNNIVVDHDAIILSSNKATKFADWVAYKIIPSYFKGPKRKRKWEKDPKIDAQYTFIAEDYKGLTQAPYNYDRGHQAPLGSLKNHPKGHVVMYLSNSTPQARNLNQGSWNDVEKQERKLAHHHGKVYVVTGPFYDKNNTIKTPIFKRINYTIPSGYWKIIAVQNRSGAVKYASFIFPQSTPYKDDYCKYLAKLAAVEKLSGLKFFSDELVVKDESLQHEIGCKRLP